MIIPQNRSPASNVLFSFKCTRLETCKTNETIDIFNNSKLKLLIKQCILDEEPLLARLNA